jgi:lysyl-tRNA synthetase class II
MGKVSFCDMVDRKGRIQLFTKIDELGEEAYSEWQRLDIGDLVGVEGEAFRTQRGERYLSRPRHMCSWQKPCGRCLRSTMASRTWTHVIASVTGPDR